MVKDKEFYRTIFKIAIPAALQSVVSFLLVISDDMMVSALPDGVNAQAAVTQVNSLTALYSATILGLVSGSAVLISQYWGKRDMERIKRIFSIVVVICLALSLMVAGAARLFPRALAGIVVDPANEHLTELAVKFLTVICFSYIPYALSAALAGMLRTIELVLIALLGSVLALAANVGFNYVFIFGKLGFPALGVAGSALSTLLARLIELAVILLYTFRVQKRLPIKPRDLMRLDREMAADYLRYGVPVGITDAQWALIGMLKAAMVGRLGSVFIAANGIMSSMLNLGTMFTFALAGGACVVVGKAVGQKDYPRVREYSKTIQILFLGIGITMAGAVFALRGPFISLYGSARDPEVYSLAMTLGTILALTLIGTTYHASCFVGINRGAGDSGFVMLVDTVCGWLIVLPATALAAFVLHWPLPAVFLCARIDQCFKWIIAFFRLRGNKWIRNVTREARA